MQIYINRKLVEFKDRHVMEDLGNGCLQRSSYHAINADDLKNHLAIYTNGNRYSNKNPGDFTDQYKIKMISEINAAIKVVIFPADKFKTGNGYHFELDNKALSPLKLINLGFENVVIELRSTAHKKAFNTNYFDNLLDQLNSSDEPMIDTNYYSWLKNNYNDNGNKSKKNYLKSLGFVYGKDKLKECSIEKLNYIHSHYYDQNFKRAR